MNILNILTSLYGLLYNRKYIPMRAFSPLRFIFRWLANKILPVYLAQKSTLLRSEKKITSERIVVSLTSFPGRINTVWIVLECMMRQTVMPDEVVLYLSKDQFKTKESVPESLWRRQNELFKIKLVENDYRSHKKYLYAFQEYPNDIVITIDDDIFYPSTMIESLVRQHCMSPNAIICRHAKTILYDLNNNLRPYREWKDVDNLHERNCVFLTGGGTLFVPNKLYKDVAKISLALKLCPLADDVWLFAMAKLGNLTICPITRYLTLPIFSESSESLCSVNVGCDMNDVQMKNVIDYYLQSIGKNPFLKEQL